MKKELKPIRFQSIRKDTVIENAYRIIEDEYNLPKGSVRLVYPSGRKAYSNSTIDALRRHWNKA